MIVIAHIKDTRTGEVRETRHEYPDDHDTDAIAYHWSEDGNYGCDCNRALFYLRAGGELGEYEFVWPSADCSIVTYLANVECEGVALVTEFDPLDSDAPSMR